MTNNDKGVNLGSPIPLNIILIYTSILALLVNFYASITPTVLEPTGIPVTGTPSISLLLVVHNCKSIERPHPVLTSRKYHRIVFKWASWSALERWQLCTTINRWTIYITTSCLIERWLAIYKCFISFDLHMHQVTSFKHWSPILPSATQTLGDILVLAPWPSPRVLLMAWPPWQRGAGTV